MKNILLTFLFISSIFLISCGDDEVEDTPNDNNDAIAVSGVVTYNGASYSISSGFLSAVNVSNDIARRTFFIADVMLSPSGTGVTAPSNFGIIITSTFSSTGTASVIPGTYDSKSDRNGRSVDIRVQTSSGTEEAFTEGTVVISESGNSYTLTFDAPFRGTRLEGTVSGTFENL